MPDVICAQLKLSHSRGSPCPPPLTLLVRCLLSELWLFNMHACYFIPREFHVWTSLTPVSRRLRQLLNSLHLFLFSYILPLIITANAFERWNTYINCFVLRKALQCNPDFLECMISLPPPLEWWDHRQAPSILAVIGLIFTKTLLGMYHQLLLHKKHQSLERSIDLLEQMAHWQPGLESQQPHFVTCAYNFHSTCFSKQALPYVSCQSK